MSIIHHHHCQNMEGDLINIIHKQRWFEIHILLAFCHIENIDYQPQNDLPRSHQTISPQLQWWVGRCAMILPPPTMWVEQLARSKVDLLLRCLYCALLPDPPVLHIAIHYSSQKSLWIPSFCLLSCRRRISSEILYRQMTPVAIFQTLSEAKGLSQSPQKDSFSSRKGCSASLLFQRLHLRKECRLLKDARKNL